MIKIFFLYLCVFSFNFPKTLVAHEHQEALVTNIEGISLQILDQADLIAAWSLKPKTLNTQAILIEAQSLIGTPYVAGGTSPNTGFDCSGFVHYVFNEAVQMQLPSNAKAMSQMGADVSKNELQAGDLVFFNTLKVAFSHVGVYIGDNQFIHSPSTGGSVRIEKFNSDYWASRFNGAKRLSLE